MTLRAWPSSTAASFRSSRRGPGAGSPRPGQRPDARQHRHRAHPVGDARRAERNQRAPAPGRRRPRRRGTQRHHRERGTAARSADRGRGHARLRHRHRGAGPPHRGRDRRRRARHEPGGRRPARAEPRRGTYGLLVMDVRRPDELVVARNGSPIVLGIGRTKCLSPPTSPRSSVHPAGRLPRRRRDRHGAGQRLPDQHAGQPEHQQDPDDGRGRGRRLRARRV